MDIPKAKLLIYALTFICYIWSGYGSNVLTNLRDAVIAAEDIFGDFMSKVSEVVQKVKSVHDTLDSSLDEECIWTCPNGAVPVANKYHKPQSNGCGSEGFKLPTDALYHTDMEKCCNEHDFCYSTCNAGQERCDAVFKRCLYNICSLNVKAGEEPSRACKAAAKMLSTATTMMGCSFFKESQSKACYCPPIKQRKKYPADEL